MEKCRLIFLNNFNKKQLTSLLMQNNNINISSKIIKSIKYAAVYFQNRCLTHHTQKASSLINLAQIKYTVNTSNYSKSCSKRIIKGNRYSSTYSKLDEKENNELTVSKSKRLMRLIYARVHPDLYTNHWQAQV